MLEYIGTEKFKWDSMMQLLCFGHTFWDKTSWWYSSFAIHAPINSTDSWFIKWGSVEPMFYCTHDALSWLITLLFTPAKEKKCNQVWRFWKKKRSGLRWRKGRVFSDWSPELSQYLWQTSEWTSLLPLSQLPESVGSPTCQLREVVFTGLRCSLTCRPQACLQF